jgi:hypothetical protein
VGGRGGRERERHRETEIEREHFHPPRRGERVDGELAKDLALGVEVPPLRQRPLVRLPLTMRLPDERDRETSNKCVVD